MTLTSALNAAMTGLRSASRSSELISSNISNAATPGYARRTLETTSNASAFLSGVRIEGVVRHGDAQVLADRRLASAEFGYRSDTTRFLTSIEDAIGTPDQPGSLSARLADFDNSLILASSRPDAAERLDSSALAARDLANTINRASDDVQGARSQADRNIAAQIDRLNDALAAVKEVNSQITATISQRGDTAALQDQRQVLIDEISEIVPVRVVPRDHGAVALFSTGGAILLDGTPASIEFEPANVVTPYMSVEDGTLSGLTVNGFAVSTSSETGRLRGGTLGAQFEIRDELAPEAQTQLDALARDLIERFEDPGVDPTLAAGQPGLFTDQGAALDPLAEEGLASRLSLNALVDPAQTGETWRIRDGLGAAAPGDVGNAQIINALSDALSDARTPATGGFGTGVFTALDLTSAFASRLGTDRLRSDQQLSFASAQLNELTQLELADGVDTDVELQRLMMVEQAYAANARVIQTVDEMIDTLLGI
ncbi:flagellar hook-associated protein FlgK [uncultured Tateyamaria sp.]|uniref:flagellar hook-associated protein FlgK n=1 Tax=Tateyamaria sp. 1078 TaxID=3417464 RepID=UPI002618B940|nr:flagellar hook-associated protein FlgK [uncultured Tateyamaria sp.]